MTKNNYQFESNTYLMNTYARYPITLVKGEGAYVWDTEGKKYLDFLCGIACTPLGHNHPDVIAAIIEQAQQILHTSNLYYSLPALELAKKLTIQGGLDKVFFCNSGAEANETAIKLVRKYHAVKNNKHKHVILSAHHSFHGRTLGALAATAKPQIQEGFGPMPAGFRYQSWDDISVFCDAIDEDVAAVIIEPIQGEGGIYPASQELLQAVRKTCDKMDALLIFDEIQCGMGRTGNLFAWQHYNVKPDVITLAKGIANGLPLGAVCAHHEIAAAFMPGDHGNTFGGNPVSCSAALATLNTIMNNNYLEKIQNLGNYISQQLFILQQKYSYAITSIRGLGLMIGIEIANKQQAQHVLTYCQNAGLLLNITNNNVLRLLPPYIILKRDIDQAITLLDKAFDKFHYENQQK